MSSIIDGIRQAQCLTVAVPAVSCSRSGGRQRGNSGHQSGYGYRDDACIHVGRTQTVAKLVRGSQDAIASKVGRRQAVQRATYKLARLAYMVDTSPNRYPMEVPQNRSDVIPSLSTRDQAGSSVLYGLQPPELVGKTVQQGVAVVESTCNESMHNRLGCISCEKSGDRTQLAQLKVARPTDGRNMICHRETAVDNHTKVTR